MLVRDDQAGVVLGADEGVGQPDLLDRPRLVPDDDLVAEPDGLGEGDQDARDEVPERRPRGQADDEARDAADEASRPPAIARTCGITRRAERTPTTTIEVMTVRRRIL